MAQNPATLRGADTVQAHQEVEPLIGGSPVFPITFYDVMGVAPAWKQADRDGWLRNFWRDFGNDMLQAVLAVSVAKIETQNWEITGPEALADMYHDIVRDEADFGAGYGPMMARGVVDYYTQDNGWFLERLRSGPEDHEGPMLGIAHLDSARMRPTGNAEFPWTYLDVHQEYHLMHRSQVIRIVDLPDPATSLYSPKRGFCALSRALSTAMILTMLVTLKREKLADLPPSALAIFNNINRKQFEKALSLHGAKQDQRGNAIWRQLMPLFGIDPEHSASVQFLSLREVWEGFDDMTAMNIAAYSFAAAWRIDPREFWPVSQGPLGTGKEAEVQHQKAKSKSTGLLFTEIERAFNHKLSLPDGLTFKFKMQDIDEEEQQASIHKTQIDNVKTMQDAGAKLSAEEVRHLFAIQYRIIPQAMTAVPVEGEASSLAHTDVIMDDVERQAKAYGGWYFGRRVKIDNYGVKEYTDFVDAALVQAFKEMVPSDVFYIGDKGGAGSGNWGHAGRPGMVGGSTSTVAPVIGAAMSITRGRTAAARQAEARKKIPPKEEASQLAEEADQGWDADVVDKVTELTHGKYGMGYFIREDGRLVDITGEYSGGTNDHVGYIVSSEQPEIIGLTKGDVARFNQLNDDLFVTEKYEWDSDEYSDAMFEWQDENMNMWGKVYDAGNVRVRIWDPRAGTGLVDARAGKVVVAMEGQLSHTTTNLKKVQRWYDQGKFPTARNAEFTWEDVTEGGGYGESITFNRNDLLFANNIRDLQQAAAGVREYHTKENLETALKEDFSCCPNHAFEMFPDVLDQLVELGQITKEQAQTVYQAPADILDIIQASVKDAVLTGQNVVNTVARAVSTASLTPYDVGEKEDNALTLINRKIASLDSATASFVRAESRALRDTFLSGNHYKKLVDIPDDVWDEAMRLDLLDEQMEG